MHYETSKLYEGPICDRCRTTMFIGTCTHRPMKKPEWSPELLKLSQEALKRQDDEKAKLAAMSPEEREKYLADWRKRFSDHLANLGESELPI